MGHVRHAICVTLVKQEEHLIPDLKNIKKEVETVTSRRFTAIADHAHIHNCVIDWERSKLVVKETTIWIRQTEPTMNRDEGGYILSHVWNILLATPSSEQ